MPRIRKPDYLEYTNCMPDRIPDIGEKVWVHFLENLDWSEGEVIRYDEDCVSNGFLIDFVDAVGEYWWWHVSTFKYGGSNCQNKLRMGRIPKQNETKT